MEVPEAAIIWLVHNASCNKELAYLSNVCTRWREIATKAILEQARRILEKEEDAGISSLLLLPSMVRYLLCRQKSMDNKIESYCLAWFHPDGIESKRLAIDPLDDSDEEGTIMNARDHRGESPPHFAPSGEELYAGSEEERKASRRQQSRPPTPLLAAVGTRLRRPEATDKHVNCMYQWNGYRDADEVLQPFGYASDFVRKVVNLAKASQNEMEIEEEQATPENKPDRSRLFEEYRSFAVRGATYARPEGYCLCWDKDHSVSLKKSLRQDTPSGLQEEEFRRLMRRRIRRRRELQREVLPRILYSTPNKIESSIRQPCVQFLNADSSHAVRLFTPPFMPGPVPAPITLFCVAIATEDGCFLSGLRNRFELGHLYPESARDNLIERSPICVCTDAVPIKSFDEYGNDEYNSDDSSCDMSLEAVGGNSGLKCECPFAGIGTILEDEDDGQRRKVWRGRRGPGMWHCYVAVFDGNSSSIRIDGVNEPLKSMSSIPSVAGAYLDGLTIGADHTFDMSLCFGQGSDGEGEGAMGELAVFKGRLELKDIETIEYYLMNKHGIRTPAQSESEVAAEDQYARLAHGMLSHVPHHKVLASGLKRVPLRYMARHRIVAWRQTNPVTGEAIRVPRIGSKSGGSSSDW